MSSNKAVMEAMEKFGSIGDVDSHRDVSFNVGFLFGFFHEKFVSKI